MPYQAVGTTTQLLDTTLDIPKPPNTSYFHLAPVLERNTTPNLLEPSPTASIVFRFLLLRFFGFSSFACVASFRRNTPTFDSQTWNLPKSGGRPLRSWASMKVCQVLFATVPGCVCPSSTATAVPAPITIIDPGPPIRDDSAAGDSALHTTWLGARVGSYLGGLTLFF